MEKDYSNGNMKFDGTSMYVEKFPLMNLAYLEWCLVEPFLKILSWHRSTVLNLAQLGRRWVRILDEL